MGRSRSEEPQAAAPPGPSALGRPRHRSESLNQQLLLLVPSPAASSCTSPPPPPPPEGFRDPSSPPPPSISPPAQISHLRRQLFTESGRSSSVLSAPPAVQEPEEGEGRISRSNTISFGEGGGGQLDGAAEQAADRLAELKLRARMPVVGSTVEASGPGSPVSDIMEHKALPAPRLAAAPAVLPPGFTCCDWLPSRTLLGDERLLQRVAYSQGPAVVQFLRDREQFTRQTSFPGQLYSHLPPPAASRPYFHAGPGPDPKATHLVVCVHGLDGNAADLRLVKTYLEMGLPGAGLQFLMSEINQLDTFQSFEDMTRKLVNEIMYHVKTCYLNIGKISFIGHSLGCILIRSAIQKPELANFSSKFHTFLSLSGPHIGTMYNNSGLVNAGMWMMQKWKKSGSLQQLALKDTSDIRSSFMYRLAERSNLHLFRHLLLAGSSQDKYVPIHSARVELCKAAVKDQSVTGSAYREMVHHLLDRVLQSDRVELVRYDIHHALPNNTNAMIGRAAHIAVLDSELFIEKFLVIAVLKYFQ